MARKNRISVPNGIYHVTTRIAHGAMLDTWIFPDQPSGVEGGKSLIDYGAMPVMLTPNEFRDGAIKAMN